jgi:hypothetical protein
MLAASSIIVDHDGGNRHKRLYKRAGVLVAWQALEPRWHYSRVLASDRQHITQKLDN